MTLLPVVLIAVYLLIGFALGVAFQVLVDQSDPGMGLAFTVGWPLVLLVLGASLGSSAVAHWIRERKK